MVRHSLKIETMKVDFKVILIAILIIVPNFMLGQFEFPSPSPAGSITQVIGNTKIAVEYERPSVRGREFSPLE